MHPPSLHLCVEKSSDAFFRGERQVWDKLKNPFVKPAYSRHRHEFAGALKDDDSTFNT